MIAVLALGQLLVIVSRGIDLSVGSTVALSGVVGAIVFSHVHSTALVILAVLGTGLAVGLANGLVFVVGRVPHPFIVTLASLSIVRGIALWAANGTLISGMPHVRRHARRRLDRLASRTRSSSSRRSRSWRCVLTTRMVWGRWLYAVGGNPDAARRAGIPVGRVLVSVYALSGLAAGIGGLLTAGLIDAGSPTAGDLAELDSIAAVIIGGAAFAGGRGNVGNALVGAFTIGVIRNALNLHNVNAFYQLIAIGVVVLIAVEGDVLRGLRRGARPRRARGEARMSAASRPAGRSRSAARRSGSAPSSGSTASMSHVRRGEVLALLGDNGAGKSTLIKCLSGALRLDSGAIEMDGEPVSIHSPAEARSRGIETVYQDLALFDNLRPSDNFYAGRELAGPALAAPLAALPQTARDGRRDRSRPCGASRSRSTSTGLSG